MVTRHRVACASMQRRGVPPVLYQFVVSVIAAAAALPIRSAADAHGIAGNRLFPGTLSFDDPAVADKFALTPSWVNLRAADGSAVTDSGREFMQLTQTRRRYCSANLILTANVRGHRMGSRGQLPRIQVIGLRLCLLLLLTPRLLRSRRRAGQGRHQHARDAFNISSRCPELRSELAKRRLRRLRTWTLS
jgi:hypothetical protein